MNEEEKMAIRHIKYNLIIEKKRCSHIYKGILGLYDNGAIEIILNLIDKQQKEIKELNKKIQRIYDTQRTIDISDINKNHISFN